MTGVTISGGANGEAADANTCGGPSIRGAQISDGETLNISQSTVTNTYSSSGSGFWGCQTNAALGIRAGSQALNEVGHLIADHLTVERYTKGGIVVDGPGSSTTITHSLVEGDQLAGASAVSSRNGIQISRGASGTVSSTTVSGNECDIASPTCGPDLVNNDQAAGILLYDPTTGQTPVPTITLSGNIVTGNDDGIYTAQMTGTPMISANTVNANRHEGVQLDEGTATLMGNQITGNGSGSGDGVFASEGDYGLADTTATLSGNTITGNASGVVVADLRGRRVHDAPDPQRNSLASNPTVGLNNEAASSVTATCNWWGQSTGPASGEVMGTATTTPFLGSSNLAGACPAHTAPSAPRPTSAVPYNDHSAKVIWQVPVSTGGTPITGYVITPYLAGVAQPAHVLQLHGDERVRHRPHRHEVVPVHGRGQERGRHRSAVGEDRADDRGCARSARCADGAGRVGSVEGDVRGAVERRCGDLQVHGFLHVVERRCPQVGDRAEQPDHGHRGHGAQVVHVHRHGHQQPGHGAEVKALGAGQRLTGRTAGPDGASVGRVESVAKVSLCHNLW